MTSLLFFIPIIIIVILLLFLHALYVAGEFAMVNAHQSQLSDMADGGHRRAKLMQDILDDDHRFDILITTCQIGITTSSIVLGIYAQQMLTTHLEPILNQWLGSNQIVHLFTIIIILLTLTCFQVIIGEVLPKSVAIQRPETIAIWLILPLQWATNLFRPLTWLFNSSANLVLRLSGLKEMAKYVGHVHTPEEIELLVTESHEGGLLDAQEQRWLRNAFRLRDLITRQVMIPRTRLVTAPIESNVISIINKATEAGFSRIPLYRDTIDNIVGFVHTRDLFKLYLQNVENPSKVLRPVTHVPETIPVADLWATLNKTGQYLAIIFDEYGGTAGIITFEDLLEEIFGEFQDEFDNELPLVSSDKDGRIYLRGRLLVGDINEYLDLNLPKDEADTIGGLVFVTLGRPPEIGDEVKLGEPPVTIRIEEIEERRIVELSLQSQQEFTTHIGDWEVADHE
ncbi:hemolysin family protein [Anaerolineales bacterium HSG24]|nr:hemolysin family protein [Anaerolineales bacterium HSG24]